MVQGAPSGPTFLPVSSPFVSPGAIGIAPQIKQALGVQPGWEDNITNALVRNTSTMSSFNKNVMNSELAVQFAVILPKVLKQKANQQIPMEFESINPSEILHHFRYSLYTLVTHEPLAVESNSVQPTQYFEYRDLNSPENVP